LLSDEPIAVVVALDLADPRDMEGENEAGISRSLVQEPDPGCDRLVGQHIHGAQPPRMGEVGLVEDSVGQKDRLLAAASKRDHAVAVRVASGGNEMDTGDYFGLS
jgi:hypothetical protein